MSLPLSGPAGDACCAQAPCGLGLAIEAGPTSRIIKEVGDATSPPRTVEDHRTNICAKLDVHGVHGLVKFAYDNKSRL